MRKTLKKVVAIAVLATLSAAATAQTEQLDGVEVTHECDTTWNLGYGGISIYSRLVLLTGDFNSYYHRDSIVAHFIEPIEATGRATVGDVWIEKCREGVYPLIGDGADADEQLDKILYVNPVEGKVLKPVSVEVDAAAYQYEGKALGDHFPLIATFQVTDRKSNNIDAPEYSKTSVTYDLQGRRTERKTKGVYISEGRKYIAE